MVLENQLLAKGIFGRPMRFEIAAWVLSLAEEISFSLDEAASAIPGAQSQKSNVQRCLKQMVQWGMLERDEAIPGRPKYRRCRSPLWDGWAAFVRAFEELERVAAGVDEAEAVPALRVVPKPGTT